jgi:hypothetical protein
MAVKKVLPLDRKTLERLVETVNFSLTLLFAFQDMLSQTGGRNVSRS